MLFFLLLKKQEVNRAWIREDIVQAHLNRVPIWKTSSIQLNHRRQLWAKIDWVGIALGQPTKSPTHTQTERKEKQSPTKKWRSHCPNAIAFQYSNIVKRLKNNNLG